ncbi:DUF2478 domain-containing protein [Salipiger aestuarii]|uniref:DUF2478 domain-containing protein n=1 Tax=Salipiger aestuarii TaxID=568098 RepID=UPI00025B8A06|nr:DUF2478 domain-containing protein [Salipiger aestuarii]EIE50798.1 hypothetical protein C357_11949 [Citreicella sp. 357]KAA8613164.1 3-dehydroquinate dehydratase [Salipiger aestuarii]
MLGYVVTNAEGQADRLIGEAAQALCDRGLRLAGAVQVNRDIGPGRKCAMNLHSLSGGGVVRISQDLGARSQGCRLDPDGLERAVGLAQAALTRGADLFVVNKFGKQEIAGRGFRPLINEALTMGLPVLTAVSAGNLAAFESYADGFGTRLSADLAAVLAWAVTVIPVREAGAPGVCLSS